MSPPAKAAVVVISLVAAAVGFIAAVIAVEAFFDPEDRPGLDDSNVEIELFSIIPPELEIGLTYVLDANVKVSIDDIPNGVRQNFFDLYVALDNQLVYFERLPGNNLFASGDLFFEFPFTVHIAAQEWGEECIDRFTDLAIIGLIAEMNPVPRPSAPPEIHGIFNGDIRQGFWIEGKGLMSERDINDEFRVRIKKLEQVSDTMVVKNPFFVNITKNDSDNESSTPDFNHHEDFDFGFEAHINYRASYSNANVNNPEPPIGNVTVDGLSSYDDWTIRTLSDESPFEYEVEVGRLKQSHREFLYTVEHNIGEDPIDPEDIFTEDESIFDGHHPLDTALYRDEWGVFIEGTNNIVTTILDENGEKQPKTIEYNWSAPFRTSANSSEGCTPSEFIVRDEDPHEVRELDVCQEGCNYVSFTEAYDDAIDGDKIHLGEGVFQLNRPLSKKGISIIGSDTEGRTIIDGGILQYDCDCNVFHNTIKNATITNAEVGIEVDSGNIVLQNVNFNRNGTGLRINHNGTVFLSNSKLENSRDDAISISGGNLRIGDTFNEDTVFISDNGGNGISLSSGASLRQAEGSLIFVHGNLGAGISAIDSSVEIVGGFINNNETGIESVGQSSSNSRLYITDSFINENVLFGIVVGESTTLDSEEDSDANSPSSFASITSNEISRNGLDGIVFNGTNDSVILLNEIADNGGCGIRMSQHTDIDVLGPIFLPSNEFLDNEDGPVCVE